jgi:hypothetical protein
MMGDLIAGLLPAEYTPLREGPKPSHNLPQARAVAGPIPAGKAADHQRSPHAKDLANAAASSGARKSAREVMHAWSVSSLVMPLPRMSR